MLVTLHQIVKDHGGGILPPARRAERAYPLDARLYTIIHTAAKKNENGELGPRLVEKTLAARA